MPSALKRPKPSIDAFVTTQTFSEAGGDATFPDLVIGDVVAVDVYHEMGKAGAINAATEALRTQAQEQEYRGVFAAYFKPYVIGHPSNNIFGCSAIGTGYRQK